MSKIDKNKSPNQNEAKDKDKGKNEVWLMLMMLINSLTCFYLVYLVDYRWKGVVEGAYVPTIFTTSNLLFSIWFVTFIVTYLYTAKELIRHLKDVRGWIKKSK